MKKTIVVLLALILVLGNQTTVLAAETGGDVRYETETLKIADPTNQSTALNATLTLPNYLGSLEAELQVTLDGEPITINATVQVVYLPNDKWDDQSYYSAMGARIRRYGAWLYTGSAQIIGWKQFYSPEFRQLNGGTTVFTPDRASRGSGSWLATRSICWPARDYTLL